MPTIHRAPAVSREFIVWANACNGVMNPTPGVSTMRKSDAWIPNPVSDLKSLTRILEVEEASEKERNSGKKKIKPGQRKPRRSFK